MATITETTDLPDFFNSDTLMTEADTFIGTTDPEFDVDWIPIQLFADRSYILQRAQNDNGRAFISLLDDAGTELGTFEGGFSAGVQTTVTVPTDGIYYIETWGDRFTGTSLEYTITVQAEIGDNVNTAETLTLDLDSSPIAVFDGTFEHAKDTDFIAVELETGYTYQVIPQSNERNASYNIVDGLGNAVSPDYPTGFTVDTAGTYFLKATTDINRPRPDELNNSYRLTLEVEPTGNDNTAYSLAPGETFADKYDGFGDIDWYAVEMRAGYSYFVNRDAGAAQDLDFVEADGDSISQFSITSARGQYQAVTPQLAGDYFVQVIPNNGAYRLSLIEEVSDHVSTASTVAVGGTVTSEFDFFRDADTFALNVIGGASYKASAILDEASTLGFTMSVIDMDGIETFASFASDEAELVFEAPATGQMYIKLASSGTLSDDDFYSLSVGLDAPGDAVVTGTTGNDAFTNTEGNDAFDGLAGDDSVTYAEASTNYTVSLRAGGDVVVFDRDGNGDTDFLTNIETLVFSDRTIALNEFDSASQLSSPDMIELAKIYAAYFNRAPDATGLFFWADKLAEGLSIEAIAEFFFDQPETRALYPDPSNTDAFVTAIYDNVLGRVPDGAGFDFWSDQLASSSITQGSFVLEIIRGAQGNDITYLQNKAELGVAFSAIGGLSDVDQGITAFNTFGGSEVADLAGARQQIEGLVDSSNASGSGDFVFRTLNVVDDPFAVA